MPSAPLLLDHMRQAIAAERLAHAYIVAAPPRGVALSFVESFLGLLYCESAHKPCGDCKACRQVATHTHPDVMWLEPQSKSRQILIGGKKDDEIGVRDMIRFLSLSPLLGRWKVGVLLFADRMNDNAGNAFLKTLEEPSGQSLILLVTDAPELLRPTIVSRCQRLTVSSDGVEHEETWRGPLLDVLRAGYPKTPLDNMVRAARIKAVLDSVKAAITEEMSSDEAESEETAEVWEARVRARLLEVRSVVFRTVLHWYRDVLLCVRDAAPELLFFKKELSVLRAQASSTDETSALRACASVESAVRLMERNISDEAALEYAGLPRLR